MRGKYHGALLAVTLCGAAASFAWQSARRKPSALAPLPLPVPLVATGSLVVAPGSLLFAASNPRIQAIVPADATVKAVITITGTRVSKTWALTVHSMGSALISGTHSIPVSSVSWTASGRTTSGNGTLTVTPGPVPLSTTPATTASGSEGNQDPFAATVTYNFRFTDSWEFVPGNYSQTALFTLAAP